MTFEPFIALFFLVAFVVCLIDRRAKRKGKTPVLTQAGTYVKDRVDAIRKREQVR